MLELDDAASRHPAAFPFVLVDKVLGLAPAERAIGLRNVTANDPLVAGGGRRPGTLRRALMIEAFAQLAAVALAPEGSPPAPVEISRIDSMRFLRSPVPGDQIVLTVELSKADPRGCRAACKAEIGGELVAEGALEFEPPAEDAAG